MVVFRALGLEADRNILEHIVYDFEYVWEGRLESSIWEVMRDAIHGIRLP